MESSKLNILITGATGFVGSHINETLFQNGHQLYCVGNPKQNHISGRRVGETFENFAWPQEAIDTLIHCAAVTDSTVQDRELVMNVNFHAALELFQKAIGKGVKRIIYASSCAVYGNGSTPFVETQNLQPLNVYGESKARLDEEAMKLKDVIIIGLRYTNVYGSGENHKGTSASMVSQIYANQTPKLFKDGNQKRDFVYIKDVVAANQLALTCSESGIFNIGSGKIASFNEVVQTWNTVTHSNRTVTYIDNPYTAYYQNHTEVDLSLARKGLKYEPKYDIKLGIEAFHKSLTEVCSCPNPALCVELKRHMRGRAWEIWNNINVDPIVAEKYRSTWKKQAKILTKSAVKAPPKTESKKPCNCKKKH